MERQVLLADPAGLVGADLSRAYRAVKTQAAPPPGLVPRSVRSPTPLYLHTRFNIVHD